MTFILYINLFIRYVTRLFSELFIRAYMIYTKITVHGLERPSSFYYDLVKLLFVNRFNHPFCDHFNKM